ncbi:MAG: YceI family protein [Rhodospirillaceae bacterium]|nr:YceI family protein [Rhodospirillaceae bacterium]MCA8931666.1 YceI family protein [Rhodospirillaceae bacterium]
MTRFATALAAAALLLPTAAAAEPFTIDNSHTYVGFTVNHLGMSTISGTFSDVEGTFDLDLEHPENSVVDITIAIASLSTGFEARDTHFLSADFFDVETYPTATFTSTAVTVTGEDTAEVTGDLTLKGETRTVVLDVTLNGLRDDHPMIDGTQAYAGFTATTTLSRSDWGLGLYAPAVADEVEVRIEMEALGPTS